MISTWAAVGIGAACFFVGGAIGVLAVSITAISKDDFGRDDSERQTEPSRGSPAQLSFIASKPRRPRLLTCRQAARRIKMSERWLYDHAADLPFTVKVGKRAVRFNADELAEWMKRR